MTCYRRFATGSRAPLLIIRTVTFCSNPLQMAPPILEAILCAIKRPRRYGYHFSERLENARNRIPHFVRPTPRSMQRLQQILRLEKLQRLHRIPFSIFTATQQICVHHCKRPQFGREHFGRYEDVNASQWTPGSRRYEEIDATKEPRQYCTKEKRTA